MVDNIDLDKIVSQSLSLPLSKTNNISVSVLRLDSIHPLISGNKWFKLRYYLDEARELQKKTLVTFGGAWSNHILAMAAAARLNGFNSIGLIRGEEPESYSPILKQVKEIGMQLHFLNRTNYRAKIIPPGVLSPDNYLINEGGLGKKGVKGAASILDFCQPNLYTHILVAVGTGTMMAGLLTRMTGGQELIGISVLKNNLELEKQIRNLSKTEDEPVIFHDYHFGGYAKYSPDLVQFMNEFYEITGIPTDFVYTGKLFFGMHDLLQKNYFPSGSKLLLIHSGGLAGNQSLDKGTLIF